METKKMLQVCLMVHDYSLLRDCAIVRHLSLACLYQASNITGQYSKKLDLMLSPNMPFDNLGISLLYLRLNCCREG